MPPLDEKKVVEHNRSARFNERKESLIKDPELADIFKSDLLATQSELHSLEGRLDKIAVLEAQYGNKPVDYDSLHTLLVKVQEALSHVDKGEQKALLQLLIHRAFTYPRISRQKGEPPRRADHSSTSILLSNRFIATWQSL